MRSSRCVLATIVFLIFTQGLGLERCPSGPFGAIF